MFLTILLAVAVPAAFLYLLHWLDLYESDRPRLVLLCFGWGLVAFLLSFAVNRFCIDVLGFTRPQVGTRTAPLVEETFKALVLFHLLRRAKLTYFVDGAIYGFAAGIGFAVIENLRYVQLFPGNPLAVVVVRDFSSALAHGTATALTGIALGGLVPSLAGRRGLLNATLCLAAGVSLHYAWNIVSFYSTLGRSLTEWALVGVGLAGLASVAATVLWGLRRERRELREMLGPALGVSREEAAIVQHLDDIDRLLDPVERRFGRIKRKQVAAFLQLEARLGIAEERARVVRDPTLQPLLAAEIPRLQADLDRQRRAVGLYAMMYVRSIFPETQVSLWARAGEDIAALRRSGFDLWAELARVLERGVSGDQQTGLGVRVERALAARVHEPRVEHASPLSEAMQQCLHWIRHDATVTVRQVAARLERREEHAAAVVEELVARGLVHRRTKGGEILLRACGPTSGAGAGARHIWRSLALATSGDHEERR